MITVENLSLLPIVVAINLCLIFVLRIVALKINLLDYPGGRKTHSSPTPLVGGLAIYFTVLSGILMTEGGGADFTAIMFWAGLVFWIGFLDDFGNIPWFFRFVAQVFACVGVIYTTGIEITYLGTYPLLGSLYLGKLSLVFTVFAVVGVTNAYNLIDGIDGLWALLLVPTSALLFVSGGSAAEFDFGLLVIITSICIFLAFNLMKNSKVNLFMGDAGSAGLGFIISFLVIAQFQAPEQVVHPPFALWLLMIPILDTFLVILRRASKNQSIFQPGSDHLHHRLLKIGYSRHHTFMILTTAAVVFAFVGLLFSRSSDIVSAFLFLVCAAILPVFLAREERRKQ